MAQRAALARALAREPELLFADEPFSALDAITRAEMQALLVDVVHRWHSAVLLVTHDIDEAILVADRIVLMGGRPATWCRNGSTSPRPGRSPRRRRRAAPRHPGRPAPRQPLIYGDSRHGHTKPSRPIHICHRHFLLRDIRTGSAPRPTTPIAAPVPVCADDLALSWMPIAVMVLGDAPAYFLLAFAAVWPILLNTAAGVSQLDANWLLLARSRSATCIQTAAGAAAGHLAYILTGVRLAIGIIWIVRVPAEMLGVSEGWAISSSMPATGWLFRPDGGDPGDRLPRLPARPRRPQPAPALATCLTAWPAGGRATAMCMASARWCGGAAMSPDLGRHRCLSVK
jgi:hypothetical protein